MKNTFIFYLFSSTFYPTKQPIQLRLEEKTNFLLLSHQPNNNYSPPFHNKIITKHPNNIPFSLSQIFSQTKHFSRFSHKPNNLDLRQIQQNFLKSSHLHHHHTNHHKWLWQSSQQLVHHLLHGPTLAPPQILRF